MERKDVLISTIGTGEKESLAHSLILPIKDIKPQVCVWVYTQHSKETYDGYIKPVLDKEYPHIENKEFMLSNHEDATLIFSEIENMFMSLQKEYNNIRVIANITSGTKVMSGVLMLYGSLIDAEFIYVGGGMRDETSGRVVKGTEKLIKFDKIVGYKNKILLLEWRNYFNMYKWQEGINTLNKINPFEEKYKTSKYILTTLTTLYEKWDLFLHIDAKDIINTIKIKKIVNNPNIYPILSSEFIESLKNNKHFLNELFTYREEILHLERKYRKDGYIEYPYEKNLSKYKIKEYSLLLADIFNNSLRRLEEGKFDDSLARWYRCFELIGQIEILYLLNIETSKVPVSMWEKYMKETYNDDYIKIGLEKTYNLLSKVEKEKSIKGVGLKYVEDKEIKNLLSKRNSSILAHGFNPIDKEDVIKMKNKIMEYIKVLSEIIKININNYIELSRFPTVNTIEYIQNKEYIHNKL